MGIHNLWQEVKPFREIASLEQLSYRHLYDTGAFLRIGVDVSIWMAKCQMGMKSKNVKSHAQLGQNPELRCILSKVAFYSRLPVILIAVFDGPSRPDQKRDTRVSKTPHWMTSRVRDIFQAFGNYNHTAPGEAEAELGYLNRSGIIDAVLTDDSDVLVFGATLIIRNPHSKDYDTVYTYSPGAFPDSPAGITHDGMLLFAILCGGDYHKGLKDCGRVTAHALAQTVLGTDLRATAEQLTPKEFEQYLKTSWIPKLQHHLRNDPQSFIGQKCPNLAAKVPSQFPSPDIIYQYVSPATSDAQLSPENLAVAPTFANAPHLINSVDVVFLKSLCEQLFSWGTDGVLEKKFESLILPGLCVREVLKGTTNHVSEFISIRSSSHPEGITIRVECDASKLSSWRHCCFVEAKTTTRNWLPAFVAKHLSSSASELRLKCLKRPLTNSKTTKIRLIDTVFDPTVYRPDSLASSPEAHIRTTLPSLSPVIGFNSAFDRTAFDNTFAVDLMRESVVEDTSPLVDPVDIFAASGPAEEDTVSALHVAATSQDQYRGTVSSVDLGSESAISDLVDEGTVSITDLTGSTADSNDTVSADFSTGNVVSIDLTGDDTVIVPDHHFTHIVDLTIDEEFPSYSVSCHENIIDLTH